MQLFFFLVRSRTLLAHDDVREHEYHDNGENTSHMLHNDSELVNTSKLYTDEMKAHIENLLLESEESHSLNSKLDAYLSNIEDFNDKNKVNIVELREEDITSRSTNREKLY